MLVLTKIPRTTLTQLPVLTWLSANCKGLEMNIKGLNTTINSMKEEIAELNTQKTRASEDRQAQKAGTTQYIL